MTSQWRELNVMVLYIAKSYRCYRESQNSMSGTPISSMKEEDQILSGIANCQPGNDCKNQSKFSPLKIMFYQTKYHFIF